LIAISSLAGKPSCAEVKPGDVITPQNAAKVAGLVSPGNAFWSARA
jgi:hypothetical protein